MTSNNGAIKRLQSRKNKPNYDLRIDFENSRFYMSNPHTFDQLKHYYSPQFTLYCAVFLATVSSNLNKLILSLKLQKQFEFNETMCNHMRNTMRFTHAFVAQNANMVASYLRRHPEQALFTGVYDPGICFPQAYYIKGLTKKQRIEINWWTHNYDQYMAERCSYFVSTRHKALEYFREHNCDMDYYCTECSIEYHFLGRYKPVNFAYFRDLMRPKIKHMELDSSYFLAPLFEEFEEVSEFYTSEELTSFTVDIPNWSNLNKWLNRDSMSMTSVVKGEQKEQQFIDDTKIYNCSFPNPAQYYVYGAFRYSIEPNNMIKRLEAHEQIHDEFETVSVDTCWLIQDFFDEFNSTYEYDFNLNRIEIDWDEVIKYCPEIFRITPKIKLIESKLPDLFRTHQTYNSLGRYKVICMPKKETVLCCDEPISKYVCSKMTRFFNRLNMLKSDCAEKPDIKQTQQPKKLIPTITESEALQAYEKSKQKTPKLKKVKKPCQPCNEQKLETNSQQSTSVAELEEKPLTQESLSFLAVSKKATLKPMKSKELNIPQYIETPSGFKIRRRLTYHAENLTNLIINIAERPELVNYGLIRSTLMSYLVHDCIKTKRPITDAQKLNINRNIAFYMTTQFTLNFKLQTFQKALDGLVDTWNHMTSEELACCKRNLLECVSYIFERLQGYPILHVFPTFFRLRGTDCPEHSYKG